MKNIHILPTDKPSKVFITKDEGLGFDNQMLENTELDCQNQNIYITSDEEIKEGEYGLSKLNEVVKFHIGYDYRYYKKIIITTDKDLIKDGVQAIDDTFLEWFVQNPSCEEVEIQKWFDGLDFLEYKIIIPKEEQCTCKIGEPYNNACCEIHGSIPKEKPNPFLADEVGHWNFPKKETLPNEVIQKSMHLDAEMAYKSLPKQETLEEAIKTYCKNKYGEGYYPDVEKGIKFGAKWQKEQYELTEDDIRSDEAFKFELKGIEKFSDGYDAGYANAEKVNYSEEEVLEILKQHHGAVLSESYDDGVLNDEKWFEQFKKQ
jgi:hypothetical protein